jgi:hypothetical protein
VRRRASCSRNRARATPPAFFITAAISAAAELRAEPFDSLNGKYLFVTENHEATVGQYDIGFQQVIQRETKSQPCPSKSFYERKCHAQNESVSFDAALHHDTGAWICHKLRRELAQL